MYGTDTISSEQKLNTKEIYFQKKNTKKTELLRNDNNDGMPDKQYKNKRIKKHSSSIFLFHFIHTLCKACVVRKHVNIPTMLKHIHLNYKRKKNEIAEKK